MGNSLNKKNSAKHTVEYQRHSASKSKRYFEMAEDNSPSNRYRTLKVVLRELLTKVHLSNTQDLNPGVVAKYIDNATSLRKKFQGKQQMLNVDVKLLLEYTFAALEDHPTSNPTKMLVLSMLLSMIEQSMKSLIENEEAALAAIRYHSNQLHFSCIGETLRASVVLTMLPNFISNESVTILEDYFSLEASIEQ